MLHHPGRSAAGKFIDAAAALAIGVLLFLVPLTALLASCGLLIRLIMRLFRESVEA